MRREHPDALADGLHDRRADEHAPDRMLDAVDLEIGLERVDLAAVGVPPHGHVDESEQRLAVLDLFGHDDHPRAGAEDRHPRVRALDDRLDERGA